ncbi:hypothetical protein [Acinetobacter oleivorans]|uniref:hypothetical protein n=1 Tax=Acinetobacter oleivorans TaxID=1148157 RepID=UPI00177E9165|nr:hypothetical protein [Acinetobacter oleivorans]
MSNLSLKTIGLISILGLSACGGDDSDSTPPKEEPPPITYVTIKGTAISRDILSDATVTARCKDDSGFKSIVKTDEKGNWEGQVKSDQLPCRLKATKNNDVRSTHYSVIFNTNDHININPFTDLAIAIRPRYSYIPSELYELAGNTINYNTLLTNLSNNNNLLARVLIEKGYDIEPSTQFFTDVIDLEGNMLDNIKGLIIAADTNRSRGSFLALVHAVHIGDYTILIPNKVAYNDPIIIPNLEACIKDDVSGIYDFCTTEVVNDFDSTSLLSVNKKTSCRLQKQGSTFIFAGNQIPLTTGFQNSDSFRKNTVEITEDGYVVLMNTMNWVLVVGGPFYSEIELKLSKEGHIKNMNLKSEYAINIPVGGLDCTPE